MRAGRNILSWIRAMDKIKTTRDMLKKFGLVMSLAFAIVATIVFLKHRHSVLPIKILSLFFLFAALIVPGILKYFYIVWMKFAFILSWFNTRLLLSIIFYLVFSPIALLMRLFRKDPLERKVEPDSSSYWKHKGKKEFSINDYHRQF
jgi:D-alanyl-lipoteichoic acid acyltransferase DltB (MBOAT superfamily)